MRFLRLLAICFASASLAEVYGPGGLAAAEPAAAPMSVMVPKGTAASSEPANASAHLSAAVLNMLLTREVAQETQVTEWVLKALTSGPTTTKGTLTVELVPHSEQAQVNLRILGNINGDSFVACQGPATIYNSTLTSLDARKPVAIDSRGIHPQPATADCDASITIHDISTNRRVVNRIAWRRASKTLPAIEAEAARLSALRVTTALDEEVRKPLEMGNAMFAKWVHEPLMARNAVPQVFRFTTTREHLQLDVLLKSGSQRGAASAAPAWQPDHDIAVRLHETVLGNAAELFLGGQRLTDRQILAAAELIAGEAPRPLWVHDRTEPWSIVLSKERPVDLKFEAGCLAVSMRTEAVQRGARLYHHPLEMTAIYNMEMTLDGPHLVRASAVKLHDLASHAVATAAEPAESEADHRAPTATEIAWGTPRPVHGDERAELFRFIHHKFEGILPDDLYLDGLTPPSGNMFGKLRRLHLVELDANGGWLSVGYKIVEEEAPAAAKTAK